MQEIAAIESMKIAEANEAKAPVDSAKAAQLQQSHDQLLAELKEAQEKYQIITDHLG